MRISIDLHTVNDFMQGSRTYVYNVTKALLRRKMEIRGGNLRKSLRKTI